MEWTSGASGGKASPSPVPRARSVQRVVEKPVFSRFLSPGASESLRPVPAALLRPQRSCLTLQRSACDTLALPFPSSTRTFLYLSYMSLPLRFRVLFLVDGLLVGVGDYFACSMIRRTATINVLSQRIDDRREKDRINDAVGKHVFTLDTRITKEVDSIKEDLEHKFALQVAENKRLLNQLVKQKNEAGSMRKYIEALEERIRLLQDEMGV